ncbi:MAG: methylenetetrahydrofolate reductase [NAD(P)H] [Elusimicrobia bacterium RIFCSPLOWO2_01_FULL_60_11]|nr:MAG: methylenetetrahydrofolate reductase [NAD(P)H] [Elusimicrobia bacterium RIFCSPLOWO2_01_FULL_60_11]
MKITDILSRRKPIFSCEFFPPKTDEATAQLFETVRELKDLDPGYVSVTYGAGGSTRGKTLEIVRRIKQELGIEAMAHLTCVGHSRSELKEVLDQIESAGIENVIALRGDPPKGETEFMPHPDGFTHAAELAGFIRKNYKFCVAVAGYPEGHVEAPDRETDWKRLEDKVKAGGDLIITQLFFDNRDFFAFEKRMREIGVKVPIIPGIMPITNLSQIIRFTRMCGAKIPEKALRELKELEDDPEAVVDYGARLAAEQCKELLERGVPGIHFYTLNKSKSTRAIIEKLKNSA